MKHNDAGLLKAFGLFLLLIAFGIVITIKVSQKTAPPAKATGDVILPTPTPNPAPLQPFVSTTDEHANKADKKLILRTTRNLNGTTTYEFFVADIQSSTGRLLFTQTMSAGASMGLPFNTWDPTDTYVFLAQLNGTVPDYLVFKADGTPFAGGNQYIDVGAVWTAKKTGYDIREATGWASGTLLIIYTKKDDGSRGPAFWFEIPSTAIIQLSS